MKTHVNKTALLALQWSLGVVLFIEAALLAFSKTEIHFAGHPGIRHWIRLALAWSEMLACVVFLIPRTMKAGATLLIMVLALAAFAHAPRQFSDRRPAHLRRCGRSHRLARALPTQGRS